VTDTKTLSSFVWGPPRYLGGGLLDGPLQKFGQALRGKVPERSIRVVAHRLRNAMAESVNGEKREISGQEASTSKIASKSAMVSAFSKEAFLVNQWISWNSKGSNS
jgi:hypothetical protein